MKATELRVNNLVHFGLSNIVRVESINPHTCICKAKYSRSGQDEFSDMISFSGDTASGNAPIESFWGIPLTEEILLKCGFEEEDVKDSIFITEEKIKIFTIDDLYLIYLDKNKCYYFAMETSLQDHWSPTLQAVSAPMQYLHTLQNYYPAFSGKELEINT